MLFIIIYLEKKPTLYLQNCTFQNLKFSGCIHIQINWQRNAYIKLDLYHIVVQCVLHVHVVRINVQQVPETFSFCHQTPNNQILHINTHKWMQTRGFLLHSSICSFNCYTVQCIRTTENNNFYKWHTSFVFFPLYNDK